jgi:SnoaL-like domain
MSMRLLRKLKEAWETQDSNAAVILYSKGSLFQDGIGKRGTTVRGRNAIRSVMLEMFALPEARFEVTSLSASQGRGAAEWIYSWTSAKSGRRNVIRGGSIFEFRNEMVVRETSYYDPEPLST